ncbi:hypothetical protein GC170_19865 [bacterium]|nr:hypothetical protein [bacterium]
MSADRSVTFTDEELQAAERRAPGWRVRCRKCGFEMPYGIWGIRLLAASRGKFILGRCLRCRHLGCMAVERSSPGKK